MTRLRPVAALEAVLAAFAALLVLAYVSKHTWLDFERGSFFGDPSQELYRVHLGGVNVYLSTISFDKLDVVNGMVLTAISAVSLVVGLGLARSGASERLQWFYVVAALGGGYLALDELFSLHESFGDNLRRLDPLPGHPDDLVLLLYVVPTAAFVWGFRDLIDSSRRARRLFASIVPVYAVAVAANFADISIENWIEIVGSLLVFAAFAVVTLDNVVLSAGLGEPLLATESRAREPLPADVPVSAS